MKEEIDTWSDDSLICPYCGHEEQVTWDHFEGQDGECDDVEFQCSKCDKYFYASRRVYFTYETFKIDEE